MMDYKQERWIAMSAYFLFFVPLLVCRHSRFARFHSNQGMLLLAFYMIVSFIGKLIPLVGKYVIIPVANMTLLAFMALGVYYAFTGQMKRLPVIGNFVIIR